MRIVPKLIFFLSFPHGSGVLWRCVVISLQVLFKQFYDLRLDPLKTVLASHSLAADGQVVLVIAVHLRLEAYLDDILLPRLDGHHHGRHASICALVQVVSDVEVFQVGPKCLQHPRPISSAGQVHDIAAVHGFPC